MIRFDQFLRRAAALLFAGLLCAPATAGDGPAGWTPIDPARLDEMRGGFVAPSGLVLSFGLERIVQVNGEVVASTRLHIPDIARMTADEARALSALGGSQTLQVGSGTVIESGTGRLVIQNSLDGQQISALTSLDVSLNTLQLYRDTQLGMAITDAVVSAAPTH